MLKRNLVNYVKNKDLIEKKIGPFHIIIKDQIEGEVDIEASFGSVIRTLPGHFLTLIDVVYIGQFSFLEEKEVNALYVDGSLFITNVQDNDDDLIDDIIHEIAHAVEDKYQQFIYEDGKIEEEFLLKRSRLKRILQHQEYDIEHLDFLNVDYNTDLDVYLYKEIGYDVLEQLTVDLFTNAYAATSLREYLASGFEEFYIGNIAFLKELCPYVYSKLNVLNENNEEL
tara:strand:- start:3847 stop:4524 length:678 start_codon:yes stop_codon:yes gene_type:complete